MTTTVSTTTTKPSERFPGRVGVFAYGVAAYALFLVTFTYLIGFVGDFVVPKTINTGKAGPIGTSMLINALLLSLFVVQHTIMARPAFKARWTRIIPRAAERSTFVLVTCCVLWLIIWQWRPMPEIVWQVHHPVGVAVIFGLYGMGWMLVLYSSFCIDHFDLFGLRHVVLYLRRVEYTHPGFARPWLYKLVRNPLMLGFLIAFWSAPVMTQGRLMFAAMVTAYIFMGVAFEERDLLRHLGDDYRRYRERTPMLLPWPRRKPRNAEHALEAASAP